MSNTQTLYLMYFTLRGYIIVLSVLEANSLLDNLDSLEPHDIQAKLIKCFITMFLGPLVIFPRLYRFFKKVFYILTK